MTKAIYIVRGEISGLVEEQAHLPEGTTEWQMSDGPSGHRGYSEDYTDLAAALRDHKEYDLNVDEADFTDEEWIIFGKFMAGKL